MPEKMTIDDFPVGVCKTVFDALNKVPARPLQDHLLLALSDSSKRGFEIILNEVYPITLADGTIIHGCMIGANNSKVWLVDLSTGGI